MVRYAVFRLLTAIPTALLVLTLVFLAMRILPGDPAVAVLGDHAGPQQIALMRERLGLNEPLWAQYLNFMHGVLQLDLGRSLANNVPIAALIAQQLPYTLELAIAANLIGALVGIPAGVIAAVRHGTTSDHTSRVVALTGLSVPEFFLGFLLLLFFGLHLRWFPLMGAGTDFLDRMYHLVLPAVTLGIIKAGFLTRLTRSAMLDVLARDYVRTAEGNGLSRRVVLFRHALRNALIPVVTALGIATLATLAGTISLELVFSRPGIGRLLVGAISARDYPLIQAGLVVFSMIVVIVNLIVDLLYALIDPRVQLR